MRYIRAVFRWLSSVFLHISLLLLIISLCFIFLFGNKQATKDVLIESGAYNNFVIAVVEDNRKASEGKPTVLPYDDPEIVEAANESFSPVALKEKTDQFIDALYAWLNGEVDQLKFTINLSKQRDLFIDKVSTYAAVRLTSLPNCTNENIGQITVFELECRPENVPLEFVKDKVSEDLHNADIFKDVLITEADLPKTESGEYLHQKLRFFPTVTQTFTDGIWVFSVLLALSATFFIGARRRRREGFRSLGRDLFSNGATFVIMTLIFGFLLPKYTNTLNVKGSETVKLLNSITDAYVRRFDLLIINIALQIIAVAVIVLALERLSRPVSIYSGVKKKSGVASSQPRKKLPSETSRSKSPPVQTSEVKKKPKTRKRKIASYRKIGL